MRKLPVARKVVLESRGKRITGWGNWSLACGLRGVPLLVALGMSSLANPPDGFAQVDARPPAPSEPKQDAPKSPESASRDGVGADPTSASRGSDEGQLGRAKELVAARRLRVAQGEQQVESAAGRLHEALAGQADPQTLVGIESRLKEAVEASFEARQALYDAQIALFDAQLHQVRLAHERRVKARETIVQQRVTELKTQVREGKAAAVVAKGTSGGKQEVLHDSGTSPARSFTVPIDNPDRELTLLRNPGEYQRAIGEARDRLTKAEQFLKLARDAGSDQPIHPSLVAESESAQRALQYVLDEYQSQLRLIRVHIERLSARYNYHRTESEVGKRLFEKGAIPRSEYDAKLALVDVTSHQLETTRELLRIYERVDEK